MSVKKYIVEVLDGITQYVQILGASDDGVFHSVMTPVNELQEADEQKQVDDAYKRGLEDGKNSIDYGCKGCKYEDQHGYDEPCNKCMYAHASHYTPMPKDEICFGDEIVVNGERGVVVSHENEGSATVWALLNSYRTPQIVHKNNYTKTGRSYDIQSILGAMRT